MGEAKDEPTIALALSGGGFRATLFHLGLIRYLRTTGKLKNVRHIAAVSGGSILAAHLAANWSLYTGSFEDFEKISAELLRFTARDVRGRIVRRLPWLILWRVVHSMLWRILSRRLPLPRSTTDLLISELKGLYRGVNLADLLTLAPESPHLSLVATNLTYPGITTFRNDSTITKMLSGEERPWEGTSIPLHLAVACSAAYPAFFSPVAVSQNDLLALKGYAVQYHCDGGVIDNQGLQTVLSYDDADQLIISDASSASVESQPAERFNLITSGLRAMELMMAQIRRANYAQMARDSARSVDLIDIEPEKVDLERNHRGAVSSQLPGIRTDLDDFDAVERQELIHHGYFSALEALKWPAVEEKFPPPEPSRGLPASVARHLRSRFSFRWRIVSWNDYVAILNLVVFLAILGFLVLQVPAMIKWVANLIDIQAVSRLRESTLGILPEGREIQMEEAQDLGERPKNPDFLVKADDRVWDLTGLEPHEDEKKNLSIRGPAYLTRSTEVSRKNAAAVYYSYWFETSGVITRGWALDDDHRLSFRLLKPAPGREPTAINGPSTLHSYKCIVDCSRIEVGKPFLIVVQAEYTDAFKIRDNWWTGMNVTDPIERAAMRIVFPANLPFDNPSFRRYPIGSRLQARAFDGTVLNVKHGSPELLWSVKRPEPGNTYRVNWDW
jgi:predicted acylesterase/phospholipase RssA